MKYQFTTTVLGVHTFNILEEKLNLDTAPVLAFDGKSWVAYDSMSAAVTGLTSVRDGRYGGSSRAIPTGFGMVCDPETHEAVASISFNGRVWDVKHVSGKPFYLEDFGLTKKALKEDMLEMNRVCGY